MSINDNVLADNIDFKIKSDSFITALRKSAVLFPGQQNV